MASALPLHRYRCRAAACGWQGLVAVSSTTAAQRTSALRQGLWLKAAVAGLLSLGFVAVAALVAWEAWRATPVLQRPSLAAGADHDGIPLPRQHPLLRRVSGDASSPAAMPASALPGANTRSASGLTLRQGCAWGTPGRNPYRGTVAQALQAARLPPATVAQLEKRIAAREVTDRLTIRRDEIRGQRSDRQYNPHSVALTYGHTLCVNAWVNFAPGHEEQADLYEVNDASGRKVAVMVPDVCGNVSVLGARGERALLQPVVDGPAADLREALGLDDLLGRQGLRYADAALADGTRNVPEPGGLLLVGLALGALWAVRRR